MATSNMPSLGLNNIPQHAVCKHPGIVLPTNTQVVEGYDYSLLVSLNSNEDPTFL